MMLAFAQVLFLASLAGAVAWLVYLARHQDAADNGDRHAPRQRDRRAFGGFPRIGRP